MQEQPDAPRAVTDPALASTQTKAARSRALSTAVSLFKGIKSAARLPQQQQQQQQQAATTTRTNGCRAATHGVQQPMQQQQPVQKQQQQQQQQLVSSAQQRFRAPGDGQRLEEGQVDQLPRRSAADDACVSHQSTSEEGREQGQGQVVHRGALKLQTETYLAKSKAKLQHMLGSTGAEASSEQRLARPPTGNHTSNSISGGWGQEQGQERRHRSASSSPSSGGWEQQQQQQQQQQQLASGSRQRGLVLGRGLLPSTQHATSASLDSSLAMETSGGQQLRVESALQLSDDMQPRRQLGRAMLGQRNSAGSSGLAQHQQRRAISCSRAWSVDSLQLAQAYEPVFGGAAEALEGLFGPPADQLDDELSGWQGGSRQHGTGSLPLGGAAEALEAEALDILFSRRHECGGRKRGRSCGGGVHGLSSGPAAGGAGSGAAFGVAQHGAQAVFDSSRHERGIFGAQLLDGGDDDGDDGDCYGGPNSSRRMRQAQGQSLGLGGQAQAQHPGAAAAAAPGWQQSPPGAATAADDALLDEWPLLVQQGLEQQRVGAAGAAAQRALRHLPAAVGAAAGQSSLERMLQSKGGQGAAAGDLAGGLLGRLSPLFKDASWEVQRASATFTYSL
jgi:hypothetical protein